MCLSRLREWWDSRPPFPQSPRIDRLATENIVEYLVWAAAEHDIASPIELRDEALIAEFLATK